MQIYEEKRLKAKEGISTMLDWSSIIDDFWKGVKRFWMIFVLVILLCVNCFYIFRVKTYSPDYYFERIYSVSRTNKTSDDLGIVMARRLAASFESTLNYSGLKKELLSCIEPELEELPGEITLTNVENTDLLNITVTSGNYYTAEELMTLFCNIFPKYANSIVGNIRLDLVSNINSDSEASGYNKVVAIVEGAVFGILLCIIWLCYYALSRKTIRKQENMRSITSMDMLQGIQEVTLKKRSSKADTRILITNRIVYGNFIAEIGRLRRKVDQIMQENGSKIVLVTSSISGEGKTMIATNLALSFAANGKRTVLLQTDFRNFTSHLLEADGPGLAEYVEGKTEIEEIQKKVESDLIFIHAGKGRGSVSDMLASDRMKKLIMYLRDTADYIVIDAAPLTTVADTSILLEVTDEVLYIVRQDFVFKRNVEEGLEMLTKSGKEAMGYVMNYAENSLTESARYGYGKYGYGKYGYGKYGYVYGKSSDQEEIKIDINAANIEEDGEKK